MAKIDDDIERLERERDYRLERINRARVEIAENARELLAKLTTRFLILSPSRLEESRGIKHWLECEAEHRAHHERAVAEIDRLTQLRDYLRETAA